MKKQFLLSSLICLVCFGLHAQQADRIQRGQRGYVPPPRYSQNTFIELKDPIEDTNIIVTKCVEAFGLDDFQKEILKNMVQENIEAENAILSDKGNTREDRKQKIIALNNQFLVELGGILTTEQVNEYKVMDFEETKEEKKEKKKKKRNKKKKDKTE